VSARPAVHNASTYTNHGDGEPTQPTPSLHSSHRQPMRVANRRYRRSGSTVLNEATQ
jgi:hypothetical protein